jgi:hypothetical protein
MPSLGAGLSDAGSSVTGDALIAEEPAQAGYQTSLEAPKPTNSLPTNKSADLETETATATETAHSGHEAGAVIALESLAAKRDAHTAIPRPGEGLVTVRAKPEKRKNYKERAKEKSKASFTDRVNDGQPASADAATSDGEAVDAIAATSVSDGQAMAHPKPEKRKNYKERAKGKLTKTKAAQDGTMPDMTAKAKSKGAANVTAKPEAKAEPKTAKKAKLKTKSAARKAA